MRIALPRTGFLRGTLLGAGLVMAVFLSVAGTTQKAEAAAVPAAAARAANPSTGGSGLLQDAQYYRHGYYRRPYARPYYRPRYYGPRYGYYRYRPRVVCRVRYGYYGPRRVCYRAY